MRHRDGMVTLDLEGRFRSVSVAHRSDDGTLHIDCVDHEKAADATLGDDASEREEQ